MTLSHLLFQGRPIENFSESPVLTQIEDTELRTAVLVSPAQVANPELQFRCFGPSKRSSQFPIGAQFDGLSRSVDLGALNP
jgi:hypothetical protein